MKLANLVQHVDLYNGSETGYSERVCTFANAVFQRLLMSYLGDVLLFEMLWDCGLDMNWHGFYHKYCVSFNFVCLMAVYMLSPQYHYCIFRNSITKYFSFTIMKMVYKISIPNRNYLFFQLTHVGMTLCCLKRLIVYVTLFP